MIIALSAPAASPSLYTFMASSRLARGISEIPQVTSFLCEWQYSTIFGNTLSWL